MYHKAIIVFLACQMALVIAAPAVESSRAEQNVQKLIDELERARASKTTEQMNKGTVVKKTTTSTVGEPIQTLSEDEQLREFMKDPVFVQQLKEFLQQFLRMYNQIHKIQEDTTTTSKVINEENVDVHELLRNPSFYNFLASFFSGQNQQGGLSGFFGQLFNQNKRPVIPPPPPMPATTYTESSETVVNENHVNRHSRPVESEPQQPQVTITHLETSNTKESVDSNPSPQATEELLENFSGSSFSHKDEEHPHHVVQTVVEETVTSTGNNENHQVDSRYDSGPQVTITHLGTEHNHESSNHGGDSISTSEDLINELRSHKTVADNYDGIFTKVNKVTPTVIYHKVPSTPIHSEEWSNIHIDPVETNPNLVQQAKNAKYQFASQIDDRITGNYQQRAEIRQNGVLYGKYSYDDGNQWRTVYYEADSRGFRVTKEEVLPTHMKDLNGQASVQTLVDGNLVDYHITDRDIASKRRGHPLL